MQAGNAEAKSAEAAIGELVNMYGQDPESSSTYAFCPGNQDMVVPQSSSKLDHSCIETMVLGNPQLVASQISV